MESQRAVTICRITIYNKLHTYLYIANPTLNWRKTGLKRSRTGQGKNAWLWGGFRDQECLDLTKHKEWAKGTIFKRLNYRPHSSNVQTGGEGQSEPGDCQRVKMVSHKLWHKRYQLLKTLQYMIVVKTNEIFLIMTISSVSRATWECIGLNKTWGTSPIHLTAPCLTVHWADAGWCSLGLVLPCSPSLVWTWSWRELACPWLAPLEAGHRCLCFQNANIIHRVFF